MILKTVVTNFVRMKMMFISIIASLALSTCGSGRSQAAAIASVDSFVEIDATDMADEPKAVVEWDKTVHDFGELISQSLRLNPGKALLYRPHIKMRMVPRPLTKPLRYTFPA